MTLTACHLILGASFASLASGQDPAHAESSRFVVGQCKLNVAAGKVGAAAECSLRDSGGNAVEPLVPAGQILRISDVSGYCLTAADDPAGGMALVHSSGWLDVPLRVKGNGRPSVRKASAGKMSVPAGPGVRASVAFPRKVSRSTVCVAAFHGYFQNAPPGGDIGYGVADRMRKEK
ncbi:MAG TPA: hypothetical protein VFA04_14430 [Bryobacteraceae bacterium]|nr:hypothetical protein [Bryobacteraceae bacterium]